MKTLTQSVVAGASLLVFASASFAMNEMYNPGMDSRRSGDPMHLIQAKRSTIVDMAISAGQFNTLVKAVQEAGLVDTLKGKGPFTVFAPTDEAFAKLPAGTLEALLQDKEKLAAVLTYHVLPSKVMAAQVRSGQVETVQGQSLSISTKGGMVMVDEAKVIKTDIVASTGVIHVIDTVVLPN